MSKSKEGRNIDYGMINYDEIYKILRTDILDGVYCRYCDTESKEIQYANLHFILYGFFRNNEKVNVKLQFDYITVYSTQYIHPILFLNDLHISFNLYDETKYNSMF